MSISNSLNILCPHPFSLITIRLLQSIEQSSLCWTAGLYWVSMLNTAVCPCPSQTPWLSLPLILPPGNHKVITEYWAESPLLSSRSLLVLLVKYGSVSMSIPNSHSNPSPISKLLNHNVSEICMKCQISHSADISGTSTLHEATWVAAFQHAWSFMSSEKFYCVSQLFHLQTF